LGKEKGEKSEIANWVKSKKVGGASTRRGELVRIRRAGYKEEEISVEKTNSEMAG